MKLKRILTGALAGTMALSLSVAALAADAPDTSNRETTITGKFQEIALEVVVPKTADAFINPYGLPIVLEAGEDVKATDDNADWTVSGQQIVTLPQTVTNLSSVDLNASVSVLGAIKEGSDMKLNATSTKVVPEGGTALTTKSAFVAFQMAVDSTLDGDSDADTIATSAAKDATWTSAAAKQVVVGTKAAVGENIVKLTKADTSGATPAAAAGGIALFRLTGDCVEDPKTPWAETDGFTTTVTFTFKPAVAASGD